MNPASLGILLCILISGCSAEGSFKPKTVEGANCKAKCASDMDLCQGSRETCDKATSTCMTACKELNDIRSRDQ